MVKNIKLLFLLFFLFVGSTFSFSGRPFEEDTLVIGARPWDDNIIQHITDGSINSPHYLDFLTDFGSKPPTQLPDNFHHLDLNDAGTHGAGRFSDYVERSPSFFQTVLIDAYTYQHLRGEHVWSNIERLLKPGAKLVVPVFFFSIGGENLSQEKAQALADEKLQMFSGIEFHSSKTLALEDLPISGLYDPKRLVNEGLIFLIATK